MSRSGQWKVAAGPAFAALLGSNRNVEGLFFEHRGCFFMDSEARAFEAIQFGSFDSLGSVPVRCGGAMVPQPITPWTLIGLAAALVRAVPRLPLQTPALIRASRNSRD